MAKRISRFCKLRGDSSDLYRLTVVERRKANYLRDVAMKIGGEANNEPTIFDQAIQILLNSENIEETMEQIATDGKGMR